MLFLCQTKRYAADVENKRGQYEHYNILPLYAVGVKPVIMELPEVCMSHTWIFIFATANDITFLIYLCFFSLSFL